MARFFERIAQPSAYIENQLTPLGVVKSVSTVKLRLIYTTPDGEEREYPVDKKGRIPPYGKLRDFECFIIREGEEIEAAGEVPQTGDTLAIRKVVFTLTLPPHEPIHPHPAPAGFPIRGRWGLPLSKPRTIGVEELAPSRQVRHESSHRRHRRGSKTRLK